MSQVDETEHQIERAFQALVGEAPSLPGDALSRIDARERQRKSHRIVGAVVGCAVVITVAVGAVALTRPTTTPVPPTQHADASNWEELSGPELAEALGLELMATNDKSQTPACDGKGFQEVKDGIGYCFLAEDYGITDPVEAELLRWQLIGVPRSSTLQELAAVEAKFRAKVLRLTKEPNGIVTTEDVRPLQRQIDELLDELFPPNGDVASWLAAHQTVDEDADSHN